VKPSNENDDLFFLFLLLAKSEAKAAARTEAIREAEKKRK